MAMPTGSHPTMMRLRASTLLVSWNDVTPVRGGRRPGRQVCTRRPGRRAAAAGHKPGGHPAPQSTTPFRTCQARGVGHEAALKHHVGVLHAAQRDLVLDLGRAEPGGALFDDEAVDLARLAAARPHDANVGPRAVADPALLAVKDPAARDLGRAGRQAARIAAVGRLRQRPAADLRRSQRRVGGGFERGGCAEPCNTCRLGRLARLTTARRAAQCPPIHAPARSAPWRPGAPSSGPRSPAARL